MKKVFSIMMMLVVLKTEFSEQHYTGKAFGRWVVERSSSLSIQGETNINSFQCDVTEYLGADTLSYTSNEVAKKLAFANSALSIDVRRFDCHSRYITSDFRSSLKADEYPVLRIRFISLDQFVNPCDKQSIKGVVNIELANAVKQAEICYTVQTLTSNRIALTGSHVFTFSDFNLKPPKKLAGLIRTKDNIKVNFRLNFKLI